MKSYGRVSLLYKVSWIVISMEEAEWVWKESQVVITSTNSSCPHRLRT